MRRYSFGMIFLVALAIAAQGIAFSQQTTVSLQGVVVRDASGDPLVQSEGRIARRTS